MSQAAVVSKGKTTKLFGMTVAVDPKLIVLLLLVIAGLAYYFTSSSSDSPGNSSGTSSSATANGVPLTRPSNSMLHARAAAVRRREESGAERGVLKFLPVDGSKGDIDPTLHLQLLERVRNVNPVNSSRNLFDNGTVAMQAQNANLPPVPKNPPRIIPTAAPPPVINNTLPTVNIPLKYYGFVKPSAAKQEGSRGFFMDGDNVLIGGEGDILEKHFLIVNLTPNSARLEDTLVKQSQDLPVTPQAMAAQ